MEVVVAGPVDQAAAAVVTAAALGRITQACGHDPSRPLLALAWRLLHVSCPVQLQRLQQMSPGPLGGPLAAMMVQGRVCMKVVLGGMMGWALLGAAPQVVGVWRLWRRHPCHLGCSSSSSRGRRQWCLQGSSSRGSSCSQLATLQCLQLVREVKRRRRRSMWKTRRQERLYS